MQDTLTRSKGSSMYLTKTHVWGHFDDACVSIQGRYPSSIAGRMLDVCDELMDEFEERVAHVFVTKSGSPAKELCGRNGLGVCKNQMGEWGVDKPLKSPFSLQSSNNYDL